MVASLPGFALREPRLSSLPICTMPALRALLFGKQIGRPRFWCFPALSRSGLHLFFVSKVLPLSKSALFVMRVTVNSV